MITKTLTRRQALIAAAAAERKNNEERAKLVQILEDQKAVRDARYAARKARGRK